MWVSDMNHSCGIASIRTWLNFICVRFYAGRRKLLIVADIKTVKEIMVKEFDVFTDREVSVVCIEIMQRPSQ